MVTAVLKVVPWVAAVSLVSTIGCSLVVDTDECVTNADCNFGDDTELQCVQAECVPRRSEIVSSALEAETRWTADRRWIVDGVVVVKEHVTLTVEPGTHVEVPARGALVFESSASFAPSHDPMSPVVFHSLVGEQAVFMADGKAVPQTVVFR